MSIETKSVGDALELEYTLPKPKNVKKKLFHSFWSSPEKFAQNVKLLQLGNPWHKTTEGNKEFYGTNTLKEAIDMAEDGWKGGAETIEKVLNKVKAQNPLRRKPVKYGIVGSVPDVARAVAGNPLNMKVMDLTKASRRQVVTIVSDMGATCSVLASNFINRAAVVTALIDEIETAGYACDVFVYGHSKGGDCNFWSGPSSDGTVLTAVQLKNSNQPLDLTRMAFGIGHTAMFRRLTFADWGGEKFCDFLGQRLGSTVHMDYEGLAERNIFYLPTVNEECFNTEQSAIDFGIQECILYLQKQGFKGFGPIDPALLVVDKPTNKKKKAA
jgi:hypothetical protein